MNNNAVIANFNVTFSKEEEPMLQYFDSIVFPAFKKDYKKHQKVSATNDVDIYYFLNVKVIEYESNKFALSGDFVRDTKLRRKTLVIDNELQRKVDEYPTSPYSKFYIFLENHRMVLIKNENKSPGLSTFAKTVKYVLHCYLDSENKRRRENKEKLLPRPKVNIIGIATQRNVKDIIDSVQRIVELKLRFFPLNGDKNLSKVTTALTSDLSKAVGSKDGNLSFNQCENKNGVATLIEDLQGVMEPTIIVDFYDKKNVRIKNSEFTEKETIDKDEEFINNPNKIIPYVKTFDSLNNVSEDNKNIYEKFKEIVRMFL